MIRHLLFALFLASFTALQGQVTLSLSPEKVEVDVDEAMFETVAHSWLINTSEDTKTFRWIRSTESASDGWASAICDFNACYSTSVDSSITDVELGPGDSTNLDVHIRPMGIEGKAHIRLLIFEVGNPENRIEGNYLFNQTLSNADQAPQVNLKVYPNPAVDYFQLSDYQDISKVVLYTMAGREIKSFKVYPNEKFDVSHLHRGMYLVRLINRRNEVLKALRLNKR
ncbi:MAG: T9SS type A sorting domain-containing protein [Saprospiraceae bacterium]|nr:T9SS type A sorting domain-containing protein [Saprospiraceae bacterium]